MKPLAPFVCGLLLLTVPARAQESLAAAKDLYVAAEYSDALTMLTTLAARTDADARERQSVQLYRALCMVALDNTAGATEVIEQILTDDPLYRPDASDLPPRVRSVFAEARQRLLPSLVQQRYLVARTAYEQKEYQTAVEGFRLVLDGLQDPDIAGPAAQPPLADLKLLAGGFHDLAAKALSAAAAPPPPTPAAPPPPPEPVAPVTPPVAPRVFAAEDDTVVPPQTIRQAVPAFQGRVLRSGVLTIDVMIDERGAVESAAIVQPLHPQFDQTVLAAARTWQYVPASLRGTPVKYRKRLQVSLVADPRP